MAFQLSAGVNVSEIDLTTVVPSVATSIGAFAGPFSWGPANTVVTISDENRLVSMFGKPNANSVAAGGNQYEYWFSAANFLAYSNNLKVVRAANNAFSTLNASANTNGAILIENVEDYLQNHTTANTTNGPMVAKYPGGLGNSLRVSICPSSTAFSSNLTSSDGTYVTSSTSNTVIAVTGGSPVTNLYVGDLVSFDSGVSYVRTVSVTASYINVAANTTVTAGAPVLRKWQYADNFGIAPGTSTFASSVNGANDEIHIIVVDEGGSFSGVSNTVLEKFAFASKASDSKDSNGNSNYYVNLLNDKSSYVWWTGHQPGATNWGNTAKDTSFNVVRVPFTASMSGGSDGNIVTANIITGYSQFSNPDSVDAGLIISGPAGSTLAANLITLAETRKDSVVFLSPTKASVVQNPAGEVSSITSYRDGLSSSSYAFMDANWKYQYDKYNDVYRWVPMNGDVAGLTARSDYIRDPWFSPAGLNRGQIRNVIKLAWNPTKADRDNLYVKGINPILTFQGEGTVLFGDKTMLSKPSAFDRINVRRLFITLENTVSRASRFSLFELNDQFTRAQFVALVEPYLREIQGRRGITDFRVVCDTTNNTPEVIDRNEFVGDIYIKPARSINFIQLNFVATRTGVSFEEVVGRF